MGNAVKWSILFENKFLSVINLKRLVQTTVISVYKTTLVASKYIQSNANEIFLQKHHEDKYHLIKYPEYPPLHSATKGYKKSKVKI